MGCVQKADIQVCACGLQVLGSMRRSVCAISTHARNRDVTAHNAMGSGIREEKTADCPHSEKNSLEHIKG